MPGICKRSVTKAFAFCSVNKKLGLIIRPKTTSAFSFAFKQVSSVIRSSANTKIWHGILYHHNRDKHIYCGFLLGFVSQTKRVSQQATLKQTLIISLLPRTFSPFLFKVFQTFPGKCFVNLMDGLSLRLITTLL